MNGHGLPMARPMPLFAPVTAATRDGVAMGEVCCVCCGEDYGGEDCIVRDVGLDLPTYLLIGACIDGMQ
jgi:hypothetical protein